MTVKYNSGLKIHARALRQRMTDAEQTLWSKLRRKQIYGVQFYRQKPLGCYIVDFYAPGAKLAIELDGSQHFEQEHAQRDAVRDSYLQGLHLRVLRFNNLQVLHELEAVQDEIARVVNERVNPDRNKKTNPPQPPFCKGGSENVSALVGSESFSAFAPGESQNVPPFVKGGLGGIFGLSDFLGNAKKTDIAK